jgi:type II secretory pathway predicted ATPase ExeA
VTYRAFYGLTHNPFEKGACEHIYESSDYKQFFARMDYFKNVKGFALVYGEPGSGKTTSIRAFTAKLNPQLYRVIYLPLSTVTVLDFYRHLALGLGLKPCFRKVDLFHQIQDYIVNANFQKNLCPFIVIDEAQFIHNGILNDLRLIFNFQMDSKNYAMVLLSGQVSFLSQLSLHINEPLRQRITISFGFRGLSKDEIQSYLSANLKSAGVIEPLFAPDAVEAIFAFSNGLPRLINLLAEKSLLVGFQNQLKAINSEIVQLAREDLDFLTPTSLRG